MDSAQEPLERTGSVPFAEEPMQRAPPSCMPNPARRRLGCRIIAHENLSLTLSIFFTFCTTGRSGQERKSSHGEF